MLAILGLFILPCPVPCPSSLLLLLCPPSTPCPFCLHLSVSGTACPTISCSLPPCAGGSPFFHLSVSLPFCFFSFLVSVPLHTTAFSPSLSCSVPLPFSLYPSVLSSVTLPLCPIPYKCFSILHRSLLLPITNFFLKLSFLPSVPFFLLLAFFPTSSTSAFRYSCVPLHSLITLSFLHPFFFQSICCVPCPPSMPIFLCPSVILLFSLSLCFCLSLFCPSPSPGHASCLFPCLSLPLSLTLFLC